MPGAAGLSPFPAAAGEDHRIQLKHLKAHLAFQNQDQCNQARIDWATVINRHQSREHITHHLHRKINAKNPGFHAAGKLDTEDGQKALETTRRCVQERRYHGGNGFHLIGWNLRFRMFRERSRRRGICEQVFWEIVNDECNRPSLDTKERSFPEEIQYRHAVYRLTREHLRAQGANPKRHRDAVLIPAHICRGCKAIHTEAQVIEFEDLRCPTCRYSFMHQRPQDLAFTPEDPPVYITAETPPMNRREKAPCPQPITS